MGMMGGCGGVYMTGVWCGHDGWVGVVVCIHEWGMGWAWWVGVVWVLWWCVYINGVWCGHDGGQGCGGVYT